jgi:hypothetical protein
MPSTKLAALLLTLGLTACAQPDAGPPTTQDRGVDAFHSIDLRGSAELDVLVGTRQSLVIEAPAATLARVTTSVVNGMLVIETETGGIWKPSLGKVKLRVTLPTLHSLALNGTGRISVAGLAGGATAMVLSGTGALEASGTLDTLTLRVNGTGNADLTHLTAVDATVAVNGAGNVEVKVTGRLSARINGVGSISYIGEPAQLSTEINGVGHIGPSEPAKP